MPEADLSLLTEAALEAGKIASSFFRNSPEKWDKGDGQGPVTEADLKVNEMLERELLRARPDYGWLSEETEDSSERASNESVFIIDPIDGTRAFIEGSKTFAHSLAIAKDGHVQAAVVHLPELELTYTAALGKGAQLNGAPISHSAHETLETATVLSNKHNTKPEFWPGGVPPFKRHFRSSLAYRLCLVADGQFNGMLTLRPTWEWDIAAGTLIASEAGAAVSTCPSACTSSLAANSSIRPRRYSKTSKISIWSASIRTMPRPSMHGNHPPSAAWTTRICATLSPIFIACVMRNKKPVQPKNSVDRTPPEFVPEGGRNMGKSLALAAYLGATSFADAWANTKIKRRLAVGKEDPDRFEERLGKPSIPRPDGPLAWFHAASVGESLSILELLSQIKFEYPNMSLLVTTGTRSSAMLLDTRMPKNVMHQYIPVDSKKAVTAFLDHWKPSLAVWTESEFWPRLMSQTHERGVPMLLINGRISEKTTKSWKRMKGMTKSLFGRFEIMLVQTPDMVEAFSSIGANAEKITVTGSLKEGAVPLPHDATARKEMLRQIGTRPIWFAGSTHDGEEEIVAGAHRLALKKRPELLMVLAPRHPERAKEISALLERMGFTVATRSKGEKITGQTEIYLADTLGEMGLWYRIAPVSFVGGSLASVGGHNPFEPAALGSAILHGPNVHNFSDIYQRLYDGEASHCVRSEAELAQAVDRFLQPDEAAKFATSAWEVSSDGAGVTDAVLDLMRPYLDAANAS